MKQQRFTIDEIYRYLNGCVLNDGYGERCTSQNLALDCAIGLLGQRDCGIAAFTRNRIRDAKTRPLKKYVGLYCFKKGTEKIYRIVRADVKARKLVISDIEKVGKEKTITVLDFFDNWDWAPKDKIRLTVNNRLGKIMRLVRLPDLQDLTAVKMAQKDFKKHNYMEGVSRLQVDADKIRSSSPELYAILNELI